MNNPLDLEAIKARADALSDFDGEPWQVWYHTTTRVPLSVGPDNHNECFELDGMSEADAEFVAHAWADVPALVAEVERLLAEHAELVALVQPILDRTKDQIGTHSDRCFEYHVACLAGLVQARLTVPSSLNSQEDSNG